MTRLTDYLIFCSGDPPSISTSLSASPTSTPKSVLAQTDADVEEGRVASFQGKKINKKTGHETETAEVMKSTGSGARNLLVLSMVSAVSDVSGFE